jgi:Phage derived protein Gp49-like (DUF891)
LRDSSTDLRDLLESVGALVHQGDILAIALAVNGDTRMPALGFLEGLDEQDGRKFVNVFRLHAAGGRNTEKVKKLNGCDHIWEYKIDGWRLFFFRHGDICFLTHGMKKEGNKGYRKAIKRALRIRNDHLRWMKENLDHV